MKIYKLETSESILKLEGIDGKLFYNSQEIELVYLSIQSGHKIAAHSLDITVLFYILKSKVEFTIDYERINLSANQMLKIEAGKYRSISNNSNKKAKILVIKYPKNKKEEAK